jgi:O-antigen/teichoic acid export membrane protein
VTRRLLGHLVSGYLHLGVMALVTLFLVPVYVRTLGPAAWGGVAWCLTLQGLLFLVDVALGPLMMRDVARAAADGHPAAVYAHYRSLYRRIALTLFTSGLLAVLLFASTSLPALPRLTIPTAIALVLALTQFLFQFSNLAAIGFWMGRERQRHANLRLASFALAKHGAALALVTYWTPSAIAFLLPFAVISAIEFALNARQVRRDLGGEAAIAPEAPATNTGKDLGAYAVAALLGLATLQLDRVVLSLTLPVESFGRYFLLSSLLLSLMHLQMPLQRSFLPGMATAADPAAVARRMIGVAAILLALPFTVLALIPERVLGLWLHDADIAAEGAPTLRLLLIAAVLHVLSSPLSLLLMNARRYRWMIGLNTCTLSLQLVAMTLLVPTLGMLAGAVAWLISGSTQMIAALALSFRLKPPATAGTGPGDRG